MSKAFEWQGCVGGKLVEVTGVLTLLHYYFSEGKELCDKPRQSSETIRAYCSFLSLSFFFFPSSFPPSPSPSLSLSILHCFVPLFSCYFFLSWEVCSPALVKATEMTLVTHAL